MSNITRFFTAIVFSVAGAAAHANAAVEQNSCGSNICFQLTPLLTEDGSSRTPQGQLVVENGYSRTPQGQQLES
ncbi:hypothetical protein ABH909_002966 [Pseudomonas sp. BS3782 TE3695]|uniref:hypothetical protein n=1 Tax=Pseudomonas sp. BS3782 TE3695 TaxID=3349323 RepID=UPI003D2047C4